MRGVAKLQYKHLFYGFNMVAIPDTDHHGCIVKPHYRCGTGKNSEHGLVAIVL